MSEKKTTRRAAREAAFQAAYQCTVGHVAISNACEDLFARKEFDDEAKQFVKDLAEGTVTQTNVLDDTYSQFLKPGWTPERLAVSDLLILRMSIVEFYDYPEIPPKVTITEAINIAKKFGDENSGKFINGVLAKVLAESPKKDWPIIDAVTTGNLSEDLEIPLVPEDTPIEEVPYYEAPEEEPDPEPTETERTQATPDIPEQARHEPEQNRPEPPQAAPDKAEQKETTWQIKSDD